MQHTLMRAAACKQRACYIMPPDAPLALLDILEPLRPAFAYIFDTASWAPALCTMSRTESKATCLPLHHWLMGQLAPNENIGHLLGCPCTSGKNPLTAIVLHLPIPDETDSTAPSCWSSSPLPFLRMTAATPHIELDLPSPPCTAKISPSARDTPDYEGERYATARRGSWSSSDGTLVDERAMDFAEEDKASDEWDAEDALESSGSVCSSVRSVDRDGEDEDEDDMGADDDADAGLDDGNSGCCASPPFQTSMLFFDPDDACLPPVASPLTIECDPWHISGLFSGPAIFSSAKSSIDSTSSPFEEVDILTRLPLWSRLSKLFLPSWTSL